MHLSQFLPDEKVPLFALLLIEWHLFLSEPIEYEMFCQPMGFPRRYYFQKMQPQKTHHLLSIGIHPDKKLLFLYLQKAQIQNTNALKPLQYAIHHCFETIQNA